MFWHMKWKLSSSTFCTPDASQCKAAAKALFKAAKALFKAAKALCKAAINLHYLSLQS